MRGRLFGPGTILVAQYGSVGKWARAGIPVATNQAILGVQVDEERLEPRYLCHFLSATRSKFEREAQGGIVRNLSLRYFSHLAIPLPPLSEQRRIAARLDEAMADVAAARVALRQQQEELTRLTAATVEAALGGRVLAADDDPIANGPEWTALTNVARLESGHTPSRKHPEWWGGDVPWIALPDIRALDGKTATTTSERTNELGLANSSARLLPEGTVVLSRTASVGFVTVMGVPMATSQDFVNWVPGERLRSWYLAHALISARDYIRGLSDGAIHKTIYMPKLKGLRIRLPEPEEQDRALRRIDEVRETLRKAARALDSQAAALDTLGPALLNAAFKGKF
ncbi:MAG TPA: restriction endonuclease subunit S [Allosphingosinicella sp.]|nr:restriction endonuclease subunit S [Allosphingosinicella sp.]